MCSSCGVSSSSVRRNAPPGGDARRRELGARLVGPGRGPEVLERRQGTGEVLAGVRPAPRAPQPRAVGEERPRRLEAVGRVVVQAQRLAEVLVERGVGAEQPADARQPGQRPGAPLALRLGGEARQRVAGGGRVPES